MSRLADEIAATESPPEGTRERIEKTAIDLFYERGFKATTVREIAVACGLTPGALYNHFPSKDQLLSSLMRAGHSELLRWLDEALAKAGHDPRDELRAIVYTHALFHTSYRKGARVASQELYSLLEPERSEVIALRQRGSQMLRDVLERGRRTGVFDVPDLGVVANEILTMGIAIAGWFQPEGPLSAEKVAELHAELVLKMVRPIDSAGPPDISTKQKPDR